MYIRTLNIYDGGHPERPQSSNGELQEEDIISHQAVRPLTCGGDL